MSRTQSSQISGYLTGFVGLSHMNYVEYLSAVTLIYTKIPV